MKAFPKTAVFSAIGLALSVGFASAKMSRNQAVETCINQAQQESPSSGGLNTSGTNKARVVIYSGCMQQKGYRP